MEWIEGIQKALDYIEDNLTEELDYEKIGQISFSSSCHFQRVFSLLCGYTLGEYIRNRRLSMAGAELASDKVKVIDAAIKYGYDSPDSFTKAFTKFHGITPSAAREPGAKLRSFSRLTIKLSLEGGNIMDYRIDYKFSKATPSDIQVISQWYKNESVHKWICINDWNEYYEDFKNAPDYYLYSIYQDGILLAHCAGEAVDGWIAIDIIVDPSKHGQGLGTAVLLDMFAHTAELFGNIHGYIAYTTPGNIASIKCFEKAGFRYEKDDEDGAMIYKYQVD